MCVKEYNFLMMICAKMHASSALFVITGSIVYVNEGRVRTISRHLRMQPKTFTHCLHVCVFGSNASHLYLNYWPTDCHKRWPMNCRHGPFVQPRRTDCTDCLDCLDCLDCVNCVVAIVDRSLMYVWSLY